MHPARSRIGKWAVALSVPVLTCVPTAGAQLELNLPPAPEDRYFVQDYARLLDAATTSEIGRLQAVAFEQHDTPIIIVTIASMREYGAVNYSIERFAYEWFNHWEIGRRSDAGALINQGILLLVSVGDRRARIELGASWGRRWDDQAARIMNNAIVPEFSRGDYAAGILAGTRALSAIAERGPETSPLSSVAAWRDRMDDKPVRTSPLPLWGISLMMAGGIGLIGLSTFMPAHRKGLLIAGVVLIVSALLLWIVLALAAMYAKGRTDGGSGRSGSGGGSPGGAYSGGGFGSGGFSGGGGATGRW